ncbi:hypothetical protein PG989_004432 [Apiospora arundinis]
MHRDEPAFIFLRLLFLREVGALALGDGGARPLELSEMPADDRSPESWRELGPGLLSPRQET